MRTVSIRAFEYPMESNCCSEKTLKLNPSHLGRFALAFLLPQHYPDLEQKLGAGGFVEKWPIDFAAAELYCSVGVGSHLRPDPLAPDESVVLFEVSVVPPDR